MDKRSITSAENGKKGGRPKRTGSSKIEDFVALEGEVFRPVPDYNGYFASNLGRVISTKRSIPVPLKQFFHCRYYKVNLSHKDKGSHPNTVHRIVLSAFKGNCPPNCEGSHLNGDPSNNHLSNLKWESHKDNMQRKKGHGTSIQGERNPLAKLTEPEVLAIREEYSPRKTTARCLALKYKVSVCTIRDIVGGHKWKCLLPS